VSRCPHKKNFAKIRANRIKYFEEKQGKVDRSVRETLLEFSFLFEDDEVDEKREDDAGDLSPEEHQDDKVAEIQHVLTENRFAALQCNEEVGDLGF